MLRPEHGEGGPRCQIRVVPKTFKNSELGREGGRTTPEIQPKDVFLLITIIKITICNGLCIFIGGTQDVQRFRLATRRGMTMPDQTEESGNRSAVASYVATITADLATMSRRTGLDTLGYLLEMVRLEAESSSRNGQRPNGRRS